MAANKTYPILYIFCLLVFSAFNSKAKNTSFGFVENNGQILNQNRKPNNEVLFVYNQNNFQIQLTKTGFSYQILKLDQNTTLASNKISARFEPTHLNAHFIYHRVDVSFKNGNPHFDVEKLNKLGSELNVYNEYTPFNGFEHIYHFGKIIYHNIYPGIDIEFSCEPAFKYNFIVHPGAQIKDIQLAYKGGNQTKLIEQNQCLIETSLGPIVEKIPMSYLIHHQPNEQQNINVSFHKHINLAYFG